jgi:hypothetical protein
MTKFLLTYLPIISILLPLLIILTMVWVKLNILVKRQRLNDRMRNRPKLSKKLFANKYENDIWN